MNRFGFADPIARGLATAGSAHGLGTAALARKCAPRVKLDNLWLHLFAEDKLHGVHQLQLIHEALRRALLFCARERNSTSAAIVTLCPVHLFHEQ